VVMSGHLAVGYVVGWLVLGLADLLRIKSPGDLAALRVSGLAEDGPQGDPAAWGQPVGDAGLLGQQVQAQLADLTTPA
jgi:hypothetical protein